MGIKGFEQEHTKHHLQEIYPKAEYKVPDSLSNRCGLHYKSRAKTESKAYLALGFFQLNTI